MDKEAERATHGEADEENDGQVERAQWRSLFAFTTKTHVLPLIVGLLLSVGSGIVIPALSLFLGRIFGLFSDFGAGKIGGSELTQKVATNALTLVGLGSISWFLNGAFFMFWLAFGELQAGSVRDKLFDGMLKKDMEWYDMRKAGVSALIPRLQTQIREMQIATSQPLGFAVQYTVTMLIALGLAFYTAWNLTLVTLATIPPSAILLAWISARMQPAIDKQREEMTQASKLASNAISAIDTVKCFNGQDLELWQYIRAVRRGARHYLVQARSNALQIGFVRFTMVAIFVQGFWYGSHLVDSGNKTPAQVLTTFWACLMASQTIEQLLPQMIVLEKGRAAATTLRAMLLKIERGRRVQPMVGGKRPEYCDGDVRIRNVYFAYPSRPEQPALNNASFFFPAGETTFVVGKSGSGKSTLGNLLMRFYAPASGEVTIDGEPIQVLDINWLRNNITLVQQQSVLFNESIFKNVAFGRIDHGKVQKEEVKHCLETAALSDTVRDLPQGLDTMVGAGGSAMSGGQKQRIAIARARLRDTPILILDEATSALDHLTRQIVMRSIRQWRQGKTTIIITHDISQILDDDYAYVMDNGQMVQEGYRSALEESVSGPFSSFSSPSFQYPKDGRTEHQALRGTTNQCLSIIKDSPRASQESFDSMDIKISRRTSRRASRLPEIFQPSSNTHLSPQSSQQFISSLPPMAMHLNRMSNARMSILPFRNLPTSGATPFPGSSVSNCSPAEFRPLEPPPVPPKPPKRISIRRPSYHGMISLKELPRSPRLKEMLPIETRALTPVEVARRAESVKTILKTVWPRLLCKKRIVLVTGFVFAAVHAAATPVFSWVLSKLLTTFYATDDRAGKALKWSLSVLAVAIVDASAAFLMHYLLEVAGQAWVDNLRTEAMKRILDQPRSWFDREKNSLSRLNDSLDRNAEEMRNLVGRFAGFVFVAIVMTCISLVWSLTICWKLTLVGLASGPFMYGVSRGFQNVSGRWEGKSNDAGEAAGSIFFETFVNIRTVRALTLEAYFHKKYAKATTTALKVGFRRAAYSGVFFGLSDASVIFITALVFYYGSHLVASGEYSVEDILTVFAMLLFCIATINAIIAFIPQISSSKDTAVRLLRLCNLPYQTSHEHKGHVRLSIPPGPIQFKDLNFAYPTRPTQPVLSSFTLTIPLNTSTAIVGSSGSGKSTIASLLLGLYPISPTWSANMSPGVSDASLTVGGIDVRELHLETWRSVIGLVPQAPALFANTVAANITYGLAETSPVIDQANIRRAASMAGIDDFILSLPDGYATRVGDGGLGLSGGQVQRLGIARALVRRPAILIMDEPTSSLDGESAEGVRKTIKSLVSSGEVTIIIITHSWEMMRTCGRCVVLGEGRVLEQGHYIELMSMRDGTLRKLLGKVEGA